MTPLIDPRVVGTLPVRIALLVGHTGTTLTALRRILEAGGFGVVPVLGAQAAARARTLLPDVIVLDADMPDPELRAWEVCQALRADPVTTIIPIVAVGTAPAGTPSRN